MIRVRFAPSPTGYLHIGAARTSFFNWLFSHKNKGRFILRIEDTDFKRSSQEMCQGIIDGMRWLGMEWDEGPFFQSERTDIHRKKAEELVKSGHAYYCYCSTHTDGQERSSTSWTRCRCSSLSDKERDGHRVKKSLKAVRFLVPKREVRYSDLIHGDISVQSVTIEDFVLLRNDGMPTYHLSAVVDDMDQQISHVIRGDDHISNTPKQILLYQAFNAPVPRFAHIALILGPDKKKLSKRHGVISIIKFREEGYMPLAVLNYLAQMSWSVGEEKHVFSVEEMIDRFSLDRLSKGSPIFSLDKLEWINGQILSQMTANELFPFVQEELLSASLWKEEYEKKQKEWFLKLIDLVKQRNKTLKDFPSRMRPFLSDRFDYDQAGIEKYLHENLKDKLKLLQKDFEMIERFDAETVEKVLRARADKEGIKAAPLIHAVRMLILGMSVSPGIFEVLEMIGKEKTIARMGYYEKVLNMKI